MQFGNFYGAVILALCTIVIPAFASAQETMRVGTIERPPFAFQQNDEWTGFSIDLWQLIAQDLGFETEFVEFPSISEMLLAVQTSRIDAAAANISITHQREQVLDFSQPIFDAGLAVLMPVQS